MNTARRLASRLRWEALLWVGVAGFIGWRMWPQVAAAFGVASADAAVPPFQLTTLEGAPISDTQLRGKVVLVNFWATWCPPCRIEMPGFEKTWERYRSRDFVVLGVAMDATGRETVQRFSTSATSPIRWRWRRRAWSRTSAERSSFRPPSRSSPIISLASASSSTGRCSTCVVHG